MPHLNVEISEDAIRQAREDADRAGMKLRKYIERLILAERKPEPRAAKELTYEPVD